MLLGARLPLRRHRHQPDLSGPRKPPIGAGPSGCAQSTVLGTLPLVFWALKIIVPLKSVLFVLRADKPREVESWRCWRWRSAMLKICRYAGRRLLDAFLITRLD